MSRRAASAADSSGGLKTVGAIAFVLTLALVVLLLVNARPSPDPFDPRSGRPDGARGLVVTLESFGASVVTGRTAPEPGTESRVLVLDDRLDADQRDALLDFVEAGGVAVVADPESTLHGGAGVDGGAIRITGGRLDGERRVPVDLESNLDLGACTIGALAGLRGLTVPDGLLFPVGPEEPRCFTGDQTASGGVSSFVVVREFGSGLVVGLGDNEILTNRWLRGADNAGLAVALLAPSAGADVTILVGAGVAPSVEDIGGGEETLRDLIPAWVWMAMVLGAIAFVVFAASRAVRLGRVVSEPEVTPVDGSELVAATGNLMERAGHTAQAAWQLRHRLHRDLSGAFGVRLDAPLADLDRIVAERAGTEPGEIEALLAEQTSGEDALVRTADTIRSTRRRVFGDAGTGVDPDPPIDDPSVHQEELVR